MCRLPSDGLPAGQNQNTQKQKEKKKIPAKTVGRNDATELHLHTVHFGKKCFTLMGSWFKKKLRALLRIRSIFKPAPDPAFENEPDPAEQNIIFS
jgi:hypothetical protein